MDNYLYLYFTQFNMADTNTLLQVSAFSGLAGALLTQLITAANGYFTDKRKRSTELKNQFRNRKVEIGESFYYMTGEKLAMVRKNIRYWKNWNDSRSEASSEFLNAELKKLNAYIDKLDAENWKYALINLYFEVRLTNNEVSANNTISHNFYLKILDTTYKIKQANDADKEELYKEYAITVFDLCAHYEDICQKMNQDMETVKHALRQDFEERSVSLL